MSHFFLNTLWQKRNEPNTTNQRKSLQHNQTKSISVQITEGDFGTERHKDIECVVTKSTC